MLQAVSSPSNFCIFVLIMPYLFVVHSSTYRLGLLCVCPCNKSRTVDWLLMKFDIRKKFFF
jgi:hypothetical protein